MRHRIKQISKLIVKNLWVTLILTVSVTILGHLIQRFGYFSASSFSSQPIDAYINQEYKIDHYYLTDQEKHFKEHFSIIKDMVKEKKILVMFADISYDLIEEDQFASPEVRDFTDSYILMGNRSVLKLDSKYADENILVGAGRDIFKKDYIDIGLHKYKLVEVHNNLPEDAKSYDAYIIPASDTMMEDTHLYYSPSNYSFMTSYIFTDSRDHYEEYQDRIKDLPIVCELVDNRPIKREYVDTTLVFAALGIAASLLAIMSLYLGLIDKNMKYLAINYLCGASKRDLMLTYIIYLTIQQIPIFLFSYRFNQGTFYWVDLNFVYEQIALVSNLVFYLFGLATILIKFKKTNFLDEMRKEWL